MKINFIIGKITKRFAIVSLLSFVFIIVVQMYFLSSISTKGVQIEQIRKEIDLVRRENEILSANIDMEKSITKVKEDLKNENLVPNVAIEIETENKTAIIGR